MSKGFSVRRFNAAFYIACAGFVLGAFLAGLSPMALIFGMGYLITIAVACWISCAAGAVAAIACNIMHKKYYYRKGGQGDGRDLS